MDPLPPFFYGYLDPNHPAYTRPPTVPPGHFFHFPTSVPWFSQPQQTHGLSLPTQHFSYPPINRIQTPNGPSAFLDDTTTNDLPNQGSPALALRCFRLQRLFLIHLGSPPRRSIPQWVIFFLRCVPFLSNHRVILFPLPVNTEQFPSNPTGANPHPTPISPPPFCLNSPVGLPPEPRQPLPTPEGTSVTPLSPPPPALAFLKVYHLNLWFCSFPVMTSQSWASAWVGSFPRPSQPTTTSRRSHFLSLSFFFFSGHERFEPTIGLGGLVPASLPTHHHIPPLSFSEIELIFFSGH